MRVVSHTCSNTEIVCALGCAEMLVGVDDDSDFPADVVRGLPKIGRDLGVDPDKVARLTPDVVLTSLTVPGHEAVVEKLERLGVPVVVMDPTSLADVVGDVERIAAAIGALERGAALASELRAAFAPSESPGPGRPRVLVEWWPKPVIVPGRDSWVTEMIELAGGRNPFGGEDAKSLPVDDDAVLAAPPDAVVISWCGVRAERYRPDVVYGRPRWADLPAIRNGRVVGISEEFLGRPGPRLVEGIRCLREVVARV